ncbi:tyrosine-type recombinase/integrase [Castellaniella hirudinis]|uniref:Tyrosine-type recombinase/integrase n=1 Tax=Castellaniella hirudinis TaxID=1144617 RepID=A0ABV8RTZ1_9BURK
MASSKLTIIELKALTAEDGGRVLREPGGIEGRVRAGARGLTVQFRFIGSFLGKRRDFFLGAWPKKSLADIRVERDRIHQLVRQGIDPVAAKQAARIEHQKAMEASIQQAEQERLYKLKVHDLFDAWVADGVARKDGNAEIRRSFEKDVLPIVGEKELRHLADKDILVMLRRQMARGVIRLCVTTFKDFSQMLAWGEKRQPWRRLLANGNPAALIDINTLLPDDYEEERDRTLSPAELRELGQIFRQMDEAYAAAPNRRATSRPMDVKTRLALWICLGTICRIGELLMARWEHVDLETGIWFIPRENVKGKRGKKQEQYVFLSDFSKRQFQALHDLTGTSPWCFPSRNRRDEDTHVCLKSVSKQVGDRQIRFKNRSKPLKSRAFDNSLVLADGVNNEWTPHDLRRTGATMMQSLGISLDVIDRCQNHLLPGKVRRVYLRHDYEAEKKEAWRRLGEHLDTILV